MERSAPAVGAPAEEKVNQVNLDDGVDVLETKQYRVTQYIFYFLIKPEEHFGFFLFIYSHILTPN